MDQRSPCEPAPKSLSKSKRGFGSGGTGTGTGVSSDALKLLQQANDKFAAADQALKDGDLSAYAKNVDEAQSLVDRAIALSDKPAPKKSGN